MQRPVGDMQCAHTARLALHRNKLRFFEQICRLQTFVLFRCVLMHHHRRTTRIVSHSLGRYSCRSSAQRAACASSSAAAAATSAATRPARATLLVICLFGHTHILRRSLFVVSRRVFLRSVVVGFECGVGTCGTNGNAFALSVVHVNRSIAMFVCREQVNVSYCRSA